MHALARLTHRAFDFRMSLVADHHDVEALLTHLRDFHVHLGHERAGCVEHAQAARLGFAAHRLRDAVRAENQRAAFGHVRQFFDEDRAFLAQIRDDIGVMDDLVTHVDGRAEQLDRALDDFDRAIDARAEPARLREQDFDVGLNFVEAFKLMVTEFR